MYNARQIQKPANPVAKTMADLLTFNQGVAIRAIANSQGVYAEDVCLQELGCATDRLSRSGASWLVDHLKSLSAQRFERAS